MLARGTVAVADVANDTWVAPLLAASGLYAVLFHEILGLEANRVEPLLAEAAERLERLADDPAVREAGDRVRVELTPHAPHTTSAPLLRALAGRSAAAGEPLSIHVAESEAETAFLADGGGPLAELFRERGFGDGSWKPPGQSPVEYLDRIGLLSERTLAVHCVGIGQRDHSRLQARGVTVVTCPRSNRHLGVGRAPIPQLLREGVPVALGTDSLASVPDLDPFAEMAALREEHPSLTPAAVLRMATLNGARALRLDDRLGSIEAGKLALLVVVPLPDEETDVLELLCSTPPEVFRLAEAPWEPRS
jgi:cytosine/adenosine deaminase-related metal-dependent hydrolase